MTTLPAFSDMARLNADRIDAAIGVDDHRGRSSTQAPRPKFLSP